MQRKSTGEFFALKLVGEDENSDVEKAEAVEAVRDQEVRLLRDLSHANIIRFYNAWRHKGDDGPQYAILMEYADGGSLKMHINKQVKGKAPFAEQKVRSLFAQMVSALEYMHSGNALYDKPGKRVMHRDIKPDNILIMLNGQLKLSDVGVAKIVQQGPYAQLKMSDAGNALYKAPEAFRRHYGLPSDVWSAGAVLYELMALKPPFWAPHDDILLQAQVVKDQPCPPSPDGYGRLGDLAQSMLRKEPAERPTFAQLAQESVVAHTLANRSDERMATVLETYAPFGGLDSSCARRLGSSSAGGNEQSA